MNLGYIFVLEKRLQEYWESIIWQRKDFYKRIIWASKEIAITIEQDAWENG